VCLGLVLGRPKGLPATTEDFEEVASDVIDIEIVNQRFGFDFVDDGEEVV
jgi:hypothetical protein